MNAERPVDTAGNFVPDDVIVVLADLQPQIIASSHSNASESWCL